MNQPRGFAKNFATATEGGGRGERAGFQGVEVSRPTDRRDGFLNWTARHGVIHAMSGLIRGGR